MKPCCRPLLFTVILLCLYALTLEICERYYERDLSIYQFARKMERLHKGHADSTVIIGDSRALAIDFLDPATGPRSYNYAFSNAGGMYPYPYFLDILLDHQPPPEHIIWSFIPLMLTNAWDIFKEQPAPGASEFYRSARLYQFEDIIRPSLDNLFIHYREATKNILKAKFSITYEALRNYFEESDNQHMLRDLFNEETGGLIFSRQHRWQYTPENYLETIPFSISQNAEIFIRMFLRKAQQVQAKVYLLNMPIPEAIHSRRLKEGFYERYFTFMKSLRHEFPETLFIYDQLVAYPDDFFIDGSHLNEAGVKQFQKQDYPEFLAWLERHSGTAEGPKEMSTQ